MTILTYQKCFHYAMTKKIGEYILHFKENSNKK